MANLTIEKGILTTPKGVVIPVKQITAVKVKGKGLHIQTGARSFMVPYWKGSSLERDLALITEAMGAA